MKTSQKGLSLIKRFEGCRLSAYKDIVGVLTIGYGHTGRDVYDSETITESQADALLESDLTRFESGVNSLVTCEINQNQFDALVCFSYNVGLGNLAKSHLLIKVNASDFSGAADEFLKWDKAGGVVVAGLLRRREAERELFTGSV